jgi:hypothetical protein
MTSTTPRNRSGACSAATSSAWAPPTWRSRSGATKRQVRRHAGQPACHHPVVAHRSHMMACDTLNGPVIITGGRTPRGETTPVPIWMIRIWSEVRCNSGVCWGGDYLNLAGPPQGPSVRRRHRRPHDCSPGVQTDYGLLVECGNVIRIRNPDSLFIIEPPKALKDEYQS